MKLNEIDAAMKKEEKIHFLGVGGISMSSLAVITKGRGYTVSGSDRVRSVLTEKAEKAGIKVFYSNDKENVENADAVVYTAAAHGDNPEIIRARELSLPLISRGEYLGWLMRDYKCRIGVSGTHGKSTVTSMLTEIYLASALDPTVVNGAELESIGGAYRAGSEEYFIFEACEYCDSFLSFFPTTAVVTNLEYDHADYFKDMDQLRESFAKYINIADTAVLNADDPEAAALAGAYNGKAVTFSLCGKGDYNAENLKYEKGRGRFDITKNGKKITDVTLSVPGVHNVCNAMAAAASALENGASFEAVKAGLEGFGGAKRRFEYKGTRDGITIYDDYAHHPTEIRATLSAAANMGYTRTVCVFQPHTYSRTKALLTEFADALSLADVVILAEIFPARETDTLGISSVDLLHAIQKLGTTCYHFDTFEKIHNFILENSIHGELLITMGAGDVVNIGNNLIL